MRSSCVTSLLVALCVVSIAGCTSDAPNSPSPDILNLGGTWTGTLSVPIPGEGNSPSPIRSWTVTQSGASLSGPLVVDDPGGADDIHATLTAAVSGSQLTSATLTVPTQAYFINDGTAPGCSFSGTGTLTATASSISGPLAMTFAPACVALEIVPDSLTATWTLTLNK